MQIMTCSLTLHTPNTPSIMGSFKVIPLPSLNSPTNLYSERLLSALGQVTQFNLMHARNTQVDIREVRSLVNKAFRGLLLTR